MGKVKATTVEKSRRIKPALSPEARETQMISLATDLAEKQLIEGTASSQLITHYLKLGTMREQLELERLRHENELLKAKTTAIQESADTKALYEEALEAMKKYKGTDDEYY